MTKQIKRCSTWLNRLKWTGKGRKIDWKWTKNELKIGRNWTLNGQKINQKWTKNGQKINQKLTRNRLKWDVKWINAYEIQLSSEIPRSRIKRDKILGTEQRVILCSNSCLFPSHGGILNYLPGALLRALFCRASLEHYTINFPSISFTTQNKHTKENVNINSQF